MAQLVQHDGGKDREDEKHTANRRHQVAALAPLCKQYEPHEQEKRGVEINRNAEHRSDFPGPDHRSSSRVLGPSIRIVWFDTSVLMRERTDVHLTFYAIDFSEPLVAIIEALPLYARRFPLPVPDCTDVKDRTRRHSKQGVGMIQWVQPTR